MRSILQMAATLSDSEQASHLRMMHAQHCGREGKERNHENQQAGQLYKERKKTKAAARAALPQGAKDGVQGRQERIALAAYYIAERRGFGSCYEIDDWLEAEKSIDGGSAKSSGRTPEARSIEATAYASQLDGAADSAEPQDRIESDQIDVWLGVSM